MYIYIYIYVKIFEGRIFEIFEGKIFEGRIQKLDTVFIFIYNKKFDKGRS